jgi:hypothetical protein
MTLAFFLLIQHYLHMPDDSREIYLEALKLLNLKDVARKTGRGYRTLHAYLRKEFNPPEAAMQELVQYLKEFTTAAEQLEEALARKEEEDE